MAHCGSLKCSHCQNVRAMLGREGEDLLTNDFINRETIAQGLASQMAMPNDHSWPYSEQGEKVEWCTTVFKCGENRQAPNKEPFCNTCCYDGKHHVYWSWVVHLGINEDGTHAHSKPNRYRVVDFLYWCDESEASTRTS